MKKYSKFEFILNKTDNSLFTDAENNHLLSFFKLMLKMMKFNIREEKTELLESSYFFKNNPNSPNKDTCLTGESLIVHDKKIGNFKNIKDVALAYNRQQVQERMQNIGYLESRICRAHFRILIIDSDTKRCSAIREFLVSLGFNNLVFCDDHDAILELLKTKEVSAIIAAYKLTTGMSSLTMLRDLMKEGMAPPFILYRGYQEFEYATIKKLKYNNFLALPPGDNLSLLEDLIGKLYLQFLDGQEY